MGGDAYDIRTSAIVDVVVVVRGEAIRRPPPRERGGEGDVFRRTRPSRVAAAVAVRRRGARRRRRGRTMLPGKCLASASRMRNRHRRASEQQDGPAKG